MAITQAQYDAYEAAAITAFADRKGAKSITFADQSVTFESFDEVWKWLLWMRSQIVGASRTRYAATRKGV